MTLDRKFLFKLCSHLGYKTVAELEHTMSYKELLEWIEYSKEEPLLPDRVELQLARLTEILYRTNVSETDLTAVDFMPSISDEIKDESREKVKQERLKAQFDAFG